MNMTKQSYKLSRLLPKAELFGLQSQIQRSSTSIASNIAEGCSGTDKRLRKYLDIALGSAYELETQFLIIEENYSSIDSDIPSLIQELIGLQKGICYYRNSLPD